MRKYLLPFLIFVFLLVLSVGYAGIIGKKAHLSVSAVDYRYSLGGFAVVRIQIVNDGKKAVDSYEVSYRVFCGSKFYDDWASGGSLKPGQREKVFGITFFEEPGEDATEVLVKDIKWGT